MPRYQSDPHLPKWNCTKIFKLKKLKNPTACVIIIGNEILSGRTLDTNKQYLCKELTLNGIEVIEARVIKDDKKEIINTVNEVRKKNIPYIVVLKAWISFSLNIV